MAEEPPAIQATIEDIASSYVRSRPWPYRRWMTSVGITIHKAYYIEDLRTLELGWWPERECNAAFPSSLGRNPCSLRPIPGLGDGGAYVRLRRKDLQKGAPPRACVRYRFSGRGGILHHGGRWLINWPSMVFASR